MQVLFLCQHGGAKSVIAASYFNRLAAQRELAHVALAAAAEDPYDFVPEAVIESLQREGIDVRGFKPRRVEVGEVTDAGRIVAIDCHPPAEWEAERWDDVPPVSEDLESSTAAIRRHVDALIEELHGAR